jgi:hypothetical protein
MQLSLSIYAREEQAGVSNADYQRQQLNGAPSTRTKKFSKKERVARYEPARQCGRNESSVRTNLKSSPVWPSSWHKILGAYGWL